MQKTDNFTIFSKRFATISKYFSIASAISGIVVLVGYATHNEAMTKIFPHLPVAMNPLTALAFLSAGISLFCYNMWENVAVRRIAQILAILVAMLGLLKIAGLIFNFSIYLDSEIFKHQLSAEAMVTGRPNRMAPNTALNFFLIGLSLVALYNTKKSSRFAHILAATTFFISLLTFLGYLYGVTKLQGIVGYIPMALNTSIAFMLLSLGILFSDMKRGLTALLAQDGVGGTIIRRLIPAAILVPSFLGYLRLVGQQANFYPVELGISVFIVTTIVFFIILLWQVAVKLDKTDSERKIAASELLNEKLKAEAMLQSIGEGLVASDSAFKVVVMNPVAQTILGWNQKDAIGLELGLDVGVIENEKGEKIPQNFHPASLALSTRKKIEVDITSKEKYYCVKQDGTKVPVAITATPVMVEGNTAGVIVVFRDLSAEINLEKAKDEFISLASHQLKTPPGAIKWNVEILLDGTVGQVTKDQKETLLVIRDVADKMLETVEALLNVSRLDLGTFIVNPKPINYVDVAKEIIKELESKVVNKSITIHEDYDILPLIPADPGLAKIIVENLLSNAVKYTNNGGIVTISIKNQDTNPASILISVVDNGYGIPIQEQSKIFGKMFRAGNVAEKVEGTGFGLYLLKSIVDMSGGKIWFESKENVGTSFYVSLPCVGMKQKSGNSLLSSQIA